MRTSSSALGLVVAFVVSSSIAAGAAEPPPAVAQIVQRFVADSAGIVIWRQTVVSDQSRGGGHGEQELSVLQQDRKTLAVRVLRGVQNGQPQSAQELAAMQATLDQQYANPRLDTRFAMPFYPESVADYAFSAPKACAACMHGEQVVEFTSTVNDARHVHGTLTFDPATGRTVKAEFVPYVLPDPANSGNLAYTFGALDDGGWGVVRVDEHYAGEAMGISGTADRTTTVHGRHYRSLEEARRALQGA